MDVQESFSALHSMTSAAATFLLTLWLASLGEGETAWSTSYGRAASEAPEGQRAARSAPAIVPQPQGYERLRGALHLPSLRSVVLGRGTTDGDRYAAELIRGELQRVDVEVSIDYEGPETTDRAAIVIRPVEDTGEEGYRLEVTAGGARIEGRGEAGRFYGAMSLIQLIRAETPDVQALRIVDYPELAFRGVVDDVSLELPTLQEFKRLVRYLGEHKMNAYAFPVEAVFRFEADRTAGMGSVSAGELVELQDFAAAHHVEIIPLFRTLGHLHRVLEQPEFAGAAEYPGAGTPNVLDSAAYDLIGMLLDEIVPIFRSQYVHIGGAMSPEVGIGASADSVEAQGAAAVHLRHYRRVYAMVRRRGKDVMMQADLLEPGRAASGDSVLVIPDDVLLIDGHGSGSFPNLYGAAGRRVLAGPSLRPEGRIVPDHAATHERVSRALRRAHELGAHGSMAGGWSAGGAPLLRALRDRELAYAADRAWNPDHAETDVDERINVQFFGRDTPELRRLEASISRLTAGLRHPELWRHPLRRTSPASARRPLPGRSEAERLLADVERVQRSVSRNAEWLDHYAFAVRLASWHEDVNELAAQIRRARRNVTRPHVLEYGTEWALRLAGEARTLAQAYRSLWLRASRTANLDRVLREFDYQIAYLEEMAAALSTANVDIQAEVPSRFITSRERGNTAYLRTTFALQRGRVANAYLQVAGRNDVEVWLNGDRIGRSVGPRWSDVEVWNVATRLRSGDNVIAVRVRSRGDAAAGAPAANVYFEIHFMDGRVRRVVSDHTWKARGSGEAGWNDDSYLDAQWPPATVAPSAPALTPPMFDRGLPSRIPAEGQSDS